MKTKKFKRIEDLLKAVRSGEIKESELRIELDNDGVNFGIGWDDAICEYETDIEVAEANGYDDIEPLYKLLFPKADVDWVQGV